MRWPKALVNSSCDRWIVVTSIFQPSAATRTQSARKMRPIPTMYPKMLVRIGENHGISVNFNMVGLVKVVVFCWEICWTFKLAMALMDIYIYILGKVFGARDWLIENPKNSRTYEGQELPSTWNNHLLNLFGTQTADRRIGRILLTGLFEAGSYVQLPCCQPWHFRISIITLKPKVHDLSTLKWRSDKVCSSFGQPQFIHFVWRRNGLRARCCDCVSYYC